MSMSQEEIESLMNGLDIAEDEASEVAEEAQDLEAIVNEEAVVENAPEEAPVETAPEPVMEESPVEEISNEVEVAAAVEETQEENTPVTNDSIDDLINNLDIDEPENSEPEDNENADAGDIDELLASIETQDEDLNEPVDSSDIDDLIASLDNVSEEKVTEVASEVKEEIAPEPSVAAEPVVETKAEEPAKPAGQDATSFVEEKIQSGIFPLPADDESKVVTQLTAVAEDSEEKATKIFDVLSFILDENMAIDGSVTKISKFLDEQEKVLQTLNAKFPNVDVFSSNLEMLAELKGEPQKIKDTLNKENNELFSAMELMQYHDINRQKIERVMSVIRKLSTYLNNIFEDDNSHKEIAVAKHIAGDNTDDLVGDDDLDALIAEFGN